MRTLPHTIDRPSPHLSPQDPTTVLFLHQSRVVDVGQLDQPISSSLSNGLIAACIMHTPIPIPIPIGHLMFRTRCARCRPCGRSHVQPTHV